MQAARNVVVACGLMLLCAVHVAAAEKGPQTMPQQDKGRVEIDLQRANELLKKKQTGQKLTADEEVYLQEAARQRQATRPIVAPTPSIGLVPLTDLKDGAYKGQDGGLYGKGSNVPPAAHEAAARKELARIRPLNAKGEAADDGKIVLISIGMSNTHMEFSTFMSLAEKDPDKSSHVVLVDCAQGSMGSPAWVDAQHKRPDTNMNTWQVAEKAIKDAGLSPLQVQVAWMKQVKANPSDWGDFPQHARMLKDQLAQIAVLAKQHFPNLRVMYLSSRIYAGYANKPLHPEPYAYESAFSVRWLIQDQIAGGEQLNCDPQRGKVTAPLLLWGPYLWADGVKGRKVDDLVYQREDLTEKDGTHPSDSGMQKVAKLLLKFFKTDPLAKGWFLKEVATKPAQGNPPAFRVIGDVYYVGTDRVSSHLITSKAGHILLDTCMPDSGPTILENITDLGFDPKDVKYILITHAHIDHLGSAKFLAARTGAKICMHTADVQAAEKPDRTKMGLTEFEPFKVDRVLKDGDVVRVGDKQVQAIHSPGHTPGCLSFAFTVRDGGREYRCILFGGPGVNVFQPKNLQRGIYGGTMEDFFKTLDRLAAMPVDVWLGAHPNLNQTFQRQQRLAQGETPNPFIDPEGWKQFLAGRKEAATKI